MKTPLFLFIPFLLAFHAAYASDAENQASSFANIYTTTCLKHLTNLDVLRSKLKNAPKLPPEKAAYFLSGNAGDAWPVPDKFGTFVLALPSNKNICMVYARKADAATAEKLFTSLVAQAPSPLTSKQAINQTRQTTANGLAHKLSYEWSVPNAKNKMLFTITTSNYDAAQLQVLGSAAMVKN